MYRDGVLLVIKKYYVRVHLNTSNSLSQCLAVSDTSSLSELALCLIYWLVLPRSVVLHVLWFDILGCTAMLCSALYIMVCSTAVRCVVSVVNVYNNTCLVC